VTPAEIIAMTMRFDMRSVATALTARAAEVAIDLLGEPNRQLSSKRELRFGRKGSLAVVIDSAKAGRWFDHENRVGGDLIDLIKRIHGASFHEVITYAERIIGSVDALETSPAPAACARSADVVSTRHQRRAGELWRESVPIDGTSGARYLDWRPVIEPSLEAGDGVLRFHPDCPFGERARHPCLLALMRGIHTNEPCAIQRIALTETLMCAIQQSTFTQFTQAGGKISRMTLGPKVRTAIKVSPDEVVTQGLVVGEGLETVLSGLALGFSPAWALGDANNLSNFPVLAGIECLTILVDHDVSGTGQRAALECSARWTVAGNEVRRVIPRRPGADINNIICERAQYAGL
jgi:putative DNA primase/helicase